MAKLIKTLLKENKLKNETDYFDLIMKEYYHGKHLKASSLFNEMKAKDKDFFLCKYLNSHVFEKMIKFFIREILFD